MFVLTLHPYLSGHRAPMKHLEQFVAYMKSKPGVWFATGAQIANYVRTATPRWESPGAGRSHQRTLKRRPAARPATSGAIETVVDPDRKIIWRFPSAASRARPAIAPIPAYAAAILSPPPGSEDSSPPPK